MSTDTQHEDPTKPSYLYVPPATLISALGVLKTYLFGMCKNKDTWRYRLRFVQDYTRVPARVFGCWLKLLRAERKLGRA